MSESGGKVRPLDFACVCCSAKGKEYKYHKTQKAVRQGLALKIILQHFSVTL